MRHITQTALLIVLVGVMTGMPPAAGETTPAQSVAVELAGHGDGLDQRVADVLTSRITRWSDVNIGEPTPRKPGGVLRVIMGRYGGDADFDARCEDAGMSLPGNGEPYEEGFALKTESAGPGEAVVLLWSADKRGLLYGVGELLRALTYEPHGVEVPELDVSTAPAYRYRAGWAYQGTTMRRDAGVDLWTNEEWENYVIDLALAGANLVYVREIVEDAFGFAKSFDLMTKTGCRPNQLMWDFPDEWQATNRGPYVCPSVPEAREALLEYWADQFDKRPAHDVLRMFAGDPGGCHCDDCDPWGATFILLCEEIAEMWLERHPDSTVQIANQDVDNAGDAFIFEYLNEEPREWLDAISYGPGSNAMSTYFRPELREDLFEYPRHGPINRYLAEILNEIPARHDIVHFSDITHWISAQYEVENPDPHIAQVFGRRAFHARPKAFYEIFQQIMPFSEGDIPYSEGYHDEFHQFMWNRLLWDPHQPLEDVVNTYTEYYFGPEAAPYMTEALYQLEKNLEEPLATNTGIDEYYFLVKKAGWRLPQHYKDQDHRWHLHMQKAALDKYVQLKLRREQDMVDRAYAHLEQGQRDAAVDELEYWVVAPCVTQALEALNEPVEDAEMELLRAEAGRFGDITEERVKVRNRGYFNLDEPLVEELPWLKSELEEVGIGHGRPEGQLPPTARKPKVREILGYDDLDPGSFYDDAGNPGEQPRLIRGSAFSAREYLDPANRPSENTLAYTLGQDEGVAFRYTDLDPDAAYRVRFTFVAPRGLGIAAPEGAVWKQHVLADGEYIAQDVEYPEYTAEQFEFEIPAELTQDGQVTISLEPAEGALVTLVSEIWLLRE